MRSRRAYHGKGSKGHKWKKKDGRIDIFAYEDGYCNGPVCSVCGYGFCHHCHSVPLIPCSGAKES